MINLKVLHAAREHGINILDFIRCYRGYYMGNLNLDDMVLVYSEVYAENVSDYDYPFFSNHISEGGVLSPCYKITREDFINNVEEFYNDYYDEDDNYDSSFSDKLSFFSEWVTYVEGDDYCYVFEY